MINFFKNIYYSIWSDAINYERIKNGGETHWQIFTFAYMSVLLSLNILALLSAYLYFSGKNISVHPSFFIGRRICNRPGKTSV